MKKKKYTKEFKLQAVELAQSLESVAEASRQLGVSDGSIRTWQAKQLTDGKVPLAATPVGSEADELKRLRGEVAHLRKVNQILKAAAAFFSQDHLQ